MVGGIIMRQAKDKNDTKSSRYINISNKLLII